jgi:hypothetical protein
VFSASVTLQRAVFYVTPRASVFGKLFKTQLTTRGVRNSRRIVFNRNHSTVLHFEFKTPNFAGIFIRANFSRFFSNREIKFQLKMSPIGRRIFSYTIFDPWGNNSHGQRRHDNTNAIFDTH